MIIGGGGGKKQFVTMIESFENLAQVSFRRGFEKGELIRMAVACRKVFSMHSILRGKSSVRKQSQVRCSTVIQ